MQKWVTLSKKSEIPKWYYTSTPEEETLCDVATLDFDKHVRLERVSPDDVTHTVDLRTLHPIEHALVLFYCKGYNCIHMLGALPYTKIVELNGVIDRYVLQRAHSRFCAFEYRAPATECDIPMAELPVAIGQVTSNWNADTQVFGNVPLDKMLEFYKDPLCEEPPTTLLRACSVFAHFISVWIEHASNLPYHAKYADPRLLRNRFDNMRADAEKHMLDRLMPRFTTQLSLTRFLVHNGMKTWLESNVCEPTAQDLQCFLSEYPNYAYIPTIFIQVPTTQFTSRRLPVYKGGLVHIPCIWEDVSGWLWNLRQMEVQRAFTEWDAKRWATLPQHFVEFFKPHAVSITVWLIKHPKEKRRRKNTETASMQVPATQMDIADMEDMWRAMPPCIASLRDSHFPKNGERIQLTAILAEAGISQKTVTEFYETHNAKYPNGQDFKARYDVDAAWKYATQSGKKPVMCWYLIKNAKDKKEDTLHCPFAKESRLPDGDELRTRCYLSCAGQRFGGRPALRIRPKVDTFDVKPTQEPEMVYFTASEEEEDSD